MIVSENTDGTPSANSPFPIIVHYFRGLGYRASDSRFYASRYKRLGRVAVKVAEPEAQPVTERIAESQPVAVVKYSSALTDYLDNPPKGQCARCFQPLSEEPRLHGCSHRLQRRPAKRINLPIFQPGGELGDAACMRLGADGIVYPRDVVS